MKSKKPAKNASGRPKNPQGQSIEPTLATTTTDKVPPPPPPPPYGIPPPERKRKP